MFKHVFSKKNRSLLAELVRTDFKLRYQGSVLGYLWSLLRPLLLFIILYIVFVKVFPLGKGIPHYPVYLLLGIVIWNFFSEATTKGTSSIVDRAELIRKIRIPRWMIVLAASISALINLFLNLIVVLVFMFVNHVSLMNSAALFPLILLEVYVFALGLSFFLSAAYVKYRDMEYIWEVVLQAGFYLTPILYPLTKITNLTFQKLILLNPMAQSIQTARYSLVTHQTITANKVFDGGWHAYVPIVIVGLVLFGGVAYFRKESKYFGENI